MGWFREKEGRCAAPRLESPFVQIVCCSDEGFVDLFDGVVAAEDTTSRIC